MKNNKSEEQTAKDLEGIDLTEARRKRCEPVILSILQKMLDEGLLYNDVKYVEEKVLEYMNALFRIIVIEHQQTIFEGLTSTLQYHLRNATDKLWGKDVDNVTLEDIDKILKKEFAKNKKE